MNLHNATRVLAGLVAWGWTILAGGGGLVLLIREGPWPLTNGWFALLSGVSACPFTAWVLKTCARFEPSGYVRLGAAVFFFIVGRIALGFEGRSLLPHF